MQNLRRSGTLIILNSRMRTWKRLNKNFFKNLEKNFYKKFEKNLEIILFETSNKI